MGAREDILGAIRKNRPPKRHDLPDLPRFAAVGADDRIAAFARNLQRMGGRLLQPRDGETLPAALRRELSGGGIVCSAAPEIPGDRALADVARPADLADVEVAVLRASFGVAETGSALFTEDDLQVNALAYLAQRLMVLLDPADIVASIQDAYLRPEFHHAAYAVFHTGPSATADIEGVLVHGAQGARSLTVALLPRQA